MSQEAYNTPSETDNSLNSYLQLIYIGLLSLDVNHKLTTLPQNKTDLNFVITSTIKIVKKNDELIHRAVSLWEQIDTSDDKKYYGIVKNYLDKFEKLVHDNDQLERNLQKKDKSVIALKILIDLLFYSSISGERLLRDKLELLFNSSINREKDNEI